MTTLSAAGTAKIAAEPKRMQRMNVGTAERWLSLAGGSALVWLGLGRRSVGGLALAALGGGLIYRGATGYCPTYGALGVGTTRRHRVVARDFFDRGVHVEAGITINRPREELYRFWRNFENLPRFMRHLHSVRVLDNERSHWAAEGPAGTERRVDARILNEQENELIAWRSLNGADVDNAGSVHFRPAPSGGTEVRVVIEYIPPAGQFGRAVARLFGEEPQQQVEADLRRLKQMMEAETT